MAASAHLPQYDPVLRPVAAAYRDAPPHLALRAIACRAHSENIPRTALRTWLVSRCPGPVADVARDRPLYARHYADTARRVRRTSSLDGRRRLATQTARAIVAYLCSPMPNPEAARQVRTQVRARAAMVVLAPEFLRRAVDDGYDTIVAPAPHLAVALGCSTNSAARALTACVEAGWLVRKRSRPGSAQRYALRLRLTGGRGRIAWEHADLVDALADGAEHPWTEVLGVASHPAITYAGPGQRPVGHVPWLAALLAEADLPPDAIGLPAAQARRGLRTWLELLDATAAHSDDLVVGLDRLAEETGAAAAHRAADDARREATAREYEKRAVVTERRARVRAGLDALLEAAPVPKVTAKESEKETWLVKVERLLAEDPIPTEMHRDFRRALAHRLATQRYGYPEHVAERVAAILVPMPEDAAAEAAA